MRIAILGAGISGMLAARACNDAGFHNVTIITKEIKLDNNGLHYLHNDCGLPLRPFYLPNLLLGVRPCADPSRMYGRKVFGDSPPPTNSLQKLPAWTTIYNMAEAYEMLVDLFVRRNGAKIVWDSVDPERVYKWCRAYDLVICTIPAPSVIQPGEFPWEPVWAYRGLPEEVRTIRDLPEMFTAYHVGPETTWYRASRVFGQCFTEVARESADIMLRKIKDGSFENPHKNLLLVGRYAEWKRSRLAHEVYWRVFGHLKENSMKP